MDNELNILQESLDKLKEQIAEIKDETSTDELARQLKAKNEVVANLKNYSQIKKAFDEEIAEEHKLLMLNKSEDAPEPSIRILHGEITKN